MRNLLFTISFKGTRYHGFQVQKNALTVCEVFQNAVEKVVGRREDIKGCSRTDSGVHANHYCISMKTVCMIPCDRLVCAINCRLPDDIAVLSCREVPEDFHARYSCKKKRYIYKIDNSEIKSPFLEGLAFRYRYPIDEKLLDQAAKAFLGTHDFKAFCSTGSKVEDTVRTIYRCDVHREGRLVIVTVEGNGFLYNMVRIMVGTLLHVARGAIAPNEIGAIIDAGDRRRAGKTAPAHGLYLDEIFYE